MGEKATRSHLIEASVGILAEYGDLRLTVRQIFYQLVSRQIIANTEGEYKRVSAALTKGRQRGQIDPARIVDRTRQAQEFPGWADLSAYCEALRRQGFQRDLWQGQPFRVEVWIEKDALSEIVGQVCIEEGVTLVVGRGYPSYTATWQARQRLAECDGADPILLCLGDFDPSGEDIVRHIREVLGPDSGGCGMEDDEAAAMEFLFARKRGENVKKPLLGLGGSAAEVKHIALTEAQIEEHNLPPLPAKRTDTRTAGFIRRHGSDAVVELDALPPDVLMGLVRDAISGLRDQNTWAEQCGIEATERAQFENVMARGAGDGEA